MHLDDGSLLSVEIPLDLVKPRRRRKETTHFSDCRKLVRLRTRRKAASPYVPAVGGRISPYNPEHTEVMASCSSLPLSESKGDQELFSSPVSSDADSSSSVTKVILIVSKAAR